MENSESKDSTPSVFVQVSLLIVVFAMPRTRRSDLALNLGDMRIFERRYYNINRRLLMCFGLWPYESKVKRFALRAIVMGLLTFATIPQLISVIEHYKNVDRLMLSVLGGTGLLLVIFTTLGMILAEEKIKAVHRSIANNWQLIENYCERDILHTYSERARTLTIVYLAWMVPIGVIAAMFPLFPKILDFMRPLENPRPNIYVSGGEYFLDRETQFFTIFFADYIAIMLIVLGAIIITPVYFVYVEHCCALYAIIRYRLLDLRLKMRKNSSTSEDIDSYEWLSHTIKIHQNALTFTSLLNDSYSTMFLSTFVAALYVVPLNSCAIIASLNNPPQLVPYALCLVASMIHGFLISFPAQRIIDHQFGLLDAAYCNEWYTVPLRTKKLLLIFMLRCSEPVTLRACDFLPINLEVYFKVMKTAASYITVASSFR